MNLSDKKNNWVYSLIIFVCSFLIYIGFYHIFSMSTVLTANGLWKAINYHEYVTGKAGLETGDVIYYAVIDFIRWLFSLKSIESYYHAIIYLNAFFAAILNAGIFLFTFSVLRNRKKSVFLTLFHALSPGVFLLASNSEDIYPAYSCYVLSTFFLYYFLTTRYYVYLITSSLFLAFSLLFHWTCGMPAIISLILYVVMFDRESIQKKISNAGLVLFVLCCVFGMAALALDYPFLKIWYPGKSSDSLWISSISIEKIILLTVNSMSFFMSGIALRELNLSVIFKLSPFILFFLFFLSVLIRRTLSFFKSDRTSFLKPFLIYLVIVFFVASGMNLLEQASDPQFFIQPQFIGFIFVLIILGTAERVKYSRIILIFMFTIFLAVLFLITLTQRNKDEKHLENIQLVENTVKNPEKTLFIGQAFNLFNPFAMFKWNKPESYHYIHLPSDLKAEYELSDSAYLNKMTDTIEFYRKKNFDLILIDFVNEDPQKLGNSYIGYDLTSKMKLMQEYFRANYIIEDLENTNFYSIFYLKPKIK